MAFSLVTPNPSCSFAGKCQKPCGFSNSSKKNEYLQLKSCDADVRKHLAAVHLSKSGLREYEIILARAGIFRYKESCLEGMVVCSTHRDELGKYWRAPRPCQYPGHKPSKPKKWQRDRHVINLELASKIMDEFQCVVPIGSREYLCILRSVHFITW